MSTTLATAIYNPSTATIENVQSIIDQTPHDELIVIDHSPKRQEYPFPTIHQNGYNEGYGGALNRAAKLAQCDNLVYFSSNRSRLNDPTWIDDLTQPLADPRCGAAGSVQPCQYNRIARRPCDIFEPQIHVQGGCFAIRTAVLRNHPFSPYFPQVFSDVYLSWSLVKSGYYLADVPAISAVEAGRAKLAKMVVEYPTTIDELYQQRRRQESPINEHLATLQHYAARSNRVAEFGVETGNSTIAMLSARPRWMRSYDLNPILTDIPQVDGTDWQFVQASSLELDLPIVDTLFIDTDHTYSQLKRELDRHHNRVTRWMILHDTEEFPAMTPAMYEFLDEPNCEFVLHKHYKNNNGLSILERVKGYPQ